MSRRLLPSMPVCGCVAEWLHRSLPDSENRIRISILWWIGSILSKFGRDPRFVVSLGRRSERVTQDFRVKLATENRSEAVYSCADRKWHVIVVEGFSVLASLKIVDHVRSYTLRPKTLTKVPPTTSAELEHKPQGVEHYYVWTVIFNSECEETYMNLA